MISLYRQAIRHAPTHEKVNLFLDRADNAKAIKLSEMESLLIEARSAHSYLDCFKILEMEVQK